MDVKTRSVSENYSDLGGALNRSFCFKDETSGCSVCILETWPRGNIHWCFLYNREWNVFLCFPSLQKIETEFAEGLLIVSTNVANTAMVYSKLLRMLVEVPRVIPLQQTSLQIPGMPQEVHPLAKKRCSLSADYRAILHVWSTRIFSKSNHNYSASLEREQPSNYSSYIQRWTIYCDEKQIDPVSATTPQVLDFLVELFENGIGYIGMNTARSALSSILRPTDEIPFGCQESVKRFLKGVYEERPSMTRYTQTWDVSMVLNYLDTIPKH